MKDEVNSFMVASSHRQLTQIWNVGATPEGAELEALLLSGLVDRKGGAILSAGGAVQLQACLEGGYDSANVKQVKAALERAKSVAKIMQSYRARGTGFVVDGEKLGLGPIGKVVVTNAHVVCDPPQGDASPPDDVQIHFELYSEEFGEKEFSAQVVKSLQVDGHDCTVLKLEPDIPNEIQPLRIADLKRARNPGANVAFVIGHPLGREISFSWLNAELVGFEDLKVPRAQRMQYRSTTEQGSSGSPVFDRNWHVIGLHRAYNPNAQRLDGKAGTHAVNEGISLASIRDAFTAMAPKKKRARP
jgi:S1-C subfamily serine protease